jgi:hypothetical protein
VWRGGSFIDLAWTVRSALRNDYLPATRSFFNGVRPARTLSLGTFTALPITPEGSKNEK